MKKPKFDYTLIAFWSQGAYAKVYMIYLNNVMYFLRVETIKDKKIVQERLKKIDQLMKKKEIQDFIPKILAFGYGSRKDIIELPDTNKEQLWIIMNFVGHPIGRQQRSLEYTNYVIKQVLVKLVRLYEATGWMHLDMHIENITMLDGDIKFIDLFDIEPMDKDDVLYYLKALVLYYYGTSLDYYPNKSFHQLLTDAINDKPTKIDHWGKQIYNNMLYLLNHPALSRLISKNYDNYLTQELQESIMLANTVDQLIKVIPG